MQHRGERRGLGGIFFDDLNDCDQEMLLSFATGNCLWCLFEVFEKDIPQKKKKNSLLMKLLFSNASLWMPDSSFEINL